MGLWAGHGDLGRSWKRGGGGALGEIWRRGAVEVEANSERVEGLEARRDRESEKRRGWGGGGSFYMMRN